MLEPTPVVTPDPVPVPESTPSRRSIRWRAWSFNVVIVLVAVLIVCVGLGVVSVSMFLTCLLLFGVPLTVAGGAATVVARRSR